MERISVLLVDDHRVVRQGLRDFLELQDDIEVIGEAASGEEGVKLAQDLLPDVVLMDLVLPGIDGVEATRRVKSVSPSTRIIVLTSFADDDKVFPAVKAGAISYLLKDVQPEELARAIRAAQRNEAVLHSEVAAKLMQEFLQLAFGIAVVSGRKIFLHLGLEQLFNPEPGCFESRIEI